MAILELKQEVPDLFEKVEKALEEQESELKDVSFHKGLFIKPRGELYGILGYDSSVKANLEYLFPENFVFNGPENLEIKLNPNFKILKSNYQFENTDGFFHGRIQPDNNKPLILEVIIESNGLEAPPINKKSGWDRWGLIPVSERIDEVSSIIDNLGMEFRGDITEEERKNFRFEQILPPLEWIKLNIKYTEQKNNIHEFLMDKEGVCAQISDLFERMIYIAGGFTCHLQHKILNLPLQGYDYFSRSSEPIEGHELTKVYYDNKWHIVDPTIYNTTYNNPEIPAGVEKRAYSEMVKNYHVLKISPLKLIFLDRDYKKPKPEGDTNSRLIQTLRNKRLPEHPYLYPTVDLNTIRILK